MRESHVEEIGWFPTDEASPSLSLLCGSVDRFGSNKSLYWKIPLIYEPNCIYLLQLFPCVSRATNPFEFSSPMATITACTAPTSSFVHKRIVASPAASSVLGLPSIAKKGVVRCSMEQRPTAEETNSSKKVGMSGSLLAAACAATMSSPALALVDERMTTEGVGLPLGFSNNLLGWLLLGVFGLIWSFYIVYTSSLDEDEESGLSL